MSDYGHNHKKRRKKNPINEFLDRLRGGNRRKSYHRSEFPGINLPRDYDPVNWKERNRSEKTPAGMEDPKTGLPEEPRPREIEETRRDPVIPRPSGYSPHKKRTLSESWKLYLQMRELKKEERFKKKLKRKHRIESQKEFQKMNKGPNLGKRLFADGEEAAATPAEHKIPLLSQRNPIYRNMTIIVNSTVIFILTYILVYLFYWLTSMLVASFYGLDSILYYYDLKFNDHSPLWNRFNILMVTGIPPFLSLALALYLYQVLFKLKRFVGLQKLFILWTSLHLFNHFFGALPSGIVTDEGFGYVIAWLYMNTAFKFMFSLLSLFVLGLIGYYSAKHILETSDSFSRIKGDHRLSFILYQAALPWLIGTVVLLLARIPENFNYPYETLMLFTAVFLVIPPFFNPKVKPELNLMKVKKIRNINMGYVAMVLVLLVFLRYVLAIGLHFIIEINISISPGSG